MTTLRQRSVPCAHLHRMASGHNPYAGANHAKTPAWRSTDHSGPRRRGHWRRGRWAHAMRCPASPPPAIARCRIRLPGNGSHQASLGDRSADQWTDGGAYAPTVSRALHPLWAPDGGQGLANIVQVVTDVLPAELGLMPSLEHVLVQPLPLPLHPPVPGLADEEWRP